MSNRYNMFKSPALKQTRRAPNTPNKLPNLVYNNAEPYNERKVYNPSGRPYLPMPLERYMNSGPPENVVEPDTLKSWNYFPKQNSEFYGANPLAITKTRNAIRMGQINPYKGQGFAPHVVRMKLGRLITNARRQVFPVASRKARHRKNRKSRKTRR